MYTVISTQKRAVLIGVLKSAGLGLAWDILCDYMFACQMENTRCVIMNFRGYYTADGEVYHIEPQAALVTSRHHIYREADSLLPAGRCGKWSNAFLQVAVAC